MATKDQVLRLLSRGLTPSEIARKLNCKPEYVRATRQRASPAGADRDRAYGRKYYAADPVKYIERKRKYRAKRREESRA